MDDKQQHDPKPCNEPNEARRLADALEGKTDEQVKWTEEFSASGGGKTATVEP